MAGCGGLASGSGAASGCAHASSAVAEGVSGTAGLRSGQGLVWEDLAALAGPVEVIVLWEPAKAAGGALGSSRR